MAGYTVITPRGRLFIAKDATSEHDAKNKALSWLKSTFGLANIDESGASWDGGSSWEMTDLGNVTRHTALGQIDPGDFLWQGFGVPAPRIEGANFSLTQKNLVNGLAWDTPDPTIDTTNTSTGLGPGDAGTVDDTLDTADPIAGFLKGLGFNFNQGAGAARDFQQRQGALGAGTFNAQQAANVFSGMDWRGQREGAPERQFDTQQQFGASLGGWGGIGTRALENLKMLSGLGTKYDAPEEGATRKYFNPFTDAEVDQRGIASQLSAALQGSGVSSLYNRGVSNSDVARMFTTFAGQNPNIANADTRNLDENFLQYAAKQFGLDRFF